MSAIVQPQNQYEMQQQHRPSDQNQRQFQQPYQQQNDPQNRQQYQQQQVQQDQNNQGGNKQQQPQNNLQKQQQVQVQQQQQEAELEEEDNLVGVIKIKDGLFICDEYGAQDLEFLISNKVQRIVNTAGMQLTNHWDTIGVQYLTLNWQDDEKQILFDEAEKIPDEVFNFMNEALENHESVLVKSEKAQNRACFVIAAFVMRRYRWSMLKTLEFLNSRRQDLEMRPSFLKQLQAYENKLFKRGLGPKTQRWTEISENQDPIRNEELILRNTYLNSQQGPWAEYAKLEQSEMKRNPLLKWRDTLPINPSQAINPINFIQGAANSFLGMKNNQGQNQGTQKITIDYPKEYDLLHKKQITKQQSHYIYTSESIQMRKNINPILKTRSKSFQGMSTLESNKENIVLTEQSHQKIILNQNQNNQRPASGDKKSFTMTNITQKNVNAPPQISVSNKNSVKNTIDNDDVIPQSRQQVPHPQSAKNSVIQSQTQKNLLMQSKSNGNVNSAQPHPRSSSTRVKQVQSTSYEAADSKQQPGAQSNSVPRQSSSYSDNQKLSKLSSQNIQQPKRREPTSRVAPKNQVSANQSHLDNSVLSTSISGNQQNSANSSSLIIKQQSSGGGMKTPATGLSSKHPVAGQSPGQMQPHYPSKKQQARYQQQLNGRGYSPSYNQQLLKENQNQSQSANVSSYQSSIQKQKNMNMRSSTSKTLTDSKNPQSAYQVSNSQKKVANTTSSSYSAYNRPGSAPKQQQQSHSHVGSINTRMMGQNQIQTSMHGQRTGSGSHFQIDQNQRPGSSKVNTSQQKGQISSKGMQNTPAQMLSHGQYNGQTNQANINHTHMLSNNNSMVIRNSNSLSNMSHGRPQPGQMQKTQTQTNVNSKSVLSSFRNGPVKIMNGSGSSSHIGPNRADGTQSQQQPGQAHSSQYNRMTTMTGMHQSFNGRTHQIPNVAQQDQAQQQTAAEGRPGSAPTHQSKLRPPSPVTTAQQMQQAQHQQQAAANQNRVKYNKNMIGANQRISQPGSHGGGVVQENQNDASQNNRMGPSMSSGNNKQSYKVNNYTQVRQSVQKVHHSQIQPISKQHYH